MGKMNTKINDKDIKTVRKMIFDENIKDIDKNIVKFIYQPSFDDPFAIKIEWNNNNKPLLYFFMYPLHFLDENLKNYNKEISDEDIENLIKIINEHDFFNQPEKIEYSGFDGATWEIEIMLNGIYHKINRWSPENGVVFIIGNYLLKLSGERNNLY
jgi:hypothetical protein